MKGPVVYALVRNDEDQRAFEFGFPKFGISGACFRDPKAMLEEAARVPAAMYFIDAEFKEGPVVGTGLIRAMREKLKLKVPMVAMCPPGDTASLQAALDA